MPETPGGFGLPGVAGALFDLMEEERERQRTACKEGRLLARYAHWECRAGRWSHVLYGEVQCPDGSIQRIEQEVHRTSDPCGAPDINHVSAPELQALLGASPASVAALLEARPFATPDDLFRRPGLLKAVGEPGLFRVAVWMWRQDRHRAVHEHREELSAWHPAGVVYGVIHEKDGDQRLFIRTKAGAELMSARFVAGADIPLDEWSYRVGGFRPWELPQLEGEELEELRLLLYSRPAHAAAVLWQSAAPLLGSQEQQTAFRALSSMLGSILFKARAPRSPFGLYGYSNNGCTVVPDWNRAFQECCEAHDACYGRGGNEADRAACDAELFRCLKSKGFTGRAWLYFLGVRVLGLPVFGWSDAPSTSTVAARVTAAGSGTGTGPCSWEIRLNSMFYDGDDVGEDLRFEITADLVRQQASGRPTQRITTPPRPFRHRQRYGFHGAGLLVYNGSGGECGDATVVPIVINQTNGGPDGGIHDVSFVCNGSTYAVDLSVEVAGTGWLPSARRAAMRFSFTITTQCGGDRP